jgi:hypothetical protein
LYLNQRLCEAAWGRSTISYPFQPKRLVLRGQ